MIGCHLTTPTVGIDAMTTWKWLPLKFHLHSHLYRHGLAILLGGFELPLLYGVHCGLVEGFLVTAEHADSLYAPLHIHADQHDYHPMPFCVGRQIRKLGIGSVGGYGRLHAGGHALKLRES